MKIHRLLAIAIFSFCSLLSFAGDPPSVLAVTGGRFVFSSGGLGNSFMLDTQTGRLWRLAIGSNTNFVLTPIGYQTVANKMSLTPLSEEAELKQLKETVEKAGNTDSVKPDTK